MTRYRSERNHPDRRDYYDTDRTRDYESAPRHIDNEGHNPRRRIYPGEDDYHEDPYRRREYLHAPHQPHYNDREHDEDWDYYRDTEPDMPPWDYAPRRQHPSEYRDFRQPDRYSGEWPKKPVRRYPEHDDEDRYYAPEQRYRRNFRREQTEYPDGRYEDMERSWDRFSAYREWDRRPRNFRR